MDNKNMTGFALNGKNVGSININGKSLWSKTLSVTYYKPDNTELSTVKVGFMRAAPNLSASLPLLEKQKFIKWDKNLSQITCDLSTYPIYLSCFDVSYFYNTDKTLIDSERYLSGDYINYINIPAKKNYTISNFIPENSFSISPISSDTSVYVNDILNEVKYEICSVYEHDADDHGILLINVHSEPGDANISISYLKVGDDVWLSTSPKMSIPSSTEISIKFNGDNIIDQYTSAILSIGDAKIFNVDYIIKLSDEINLSNIRISVYDGHDADLPILNDLSNTISSTFVKWDNLAYKNVRKDLIVSAIYLPRLFNISYFNISNDLVDTQLLTYGSKSVLPTQLVTKAGYKHLYWIDNILSNEINQQTFDFISSNISAYSFLKKICYVAIHQCYANQNRQISVCLFLSGDLLDMNDFPYSGLIDVHELDPLYKFISCYIENYCGFLSSASNHLSLLYATNYYDYDMFRAQYIMKISNNEISANFKLKDNNNQLIIANSYNDLYEDFKPLYIAKYKNNEINLSTSFNFVKNDSNGKICIAENEDNILYKYIKSKFHDRTLYVMKFKANSNVLCSDFILNNNRAFTLIIEDNDILTFNKIDGQENIFKLIFDDSCKFEYRLNDNLDWKNYESNTELTNDLIQIRAIAINSNINNCRILIKGYSINNNLNYLISKYGESIIPNNFYETIVNNKPDLMLLTTKNYVKNKTTKSTIRTKTKKCTKKSNVAKIKTTKRKNKNVKDLCDISANI